MSQEEKLLNASEAAKYLGMPRANFYRNVLPYLTICRKKTSPRKFYKLSELNLFKQIVEFPAKIPAA